MPYVMIPAFPPSHQPLPVTPDSQLALPIQPIPCKPGERGQGGLTGGRGRCPGTALIQSLAVWPFWASVWVLSSGRTIPSFQISLGKKRSSTLKTIKCFPAVRGCHQSRSSPSVLVHVLYQNTNILNVK